MHFGPVHEDVSKPQFMPVCLELLNLDADDLLSLVANNKTG
jgi:hypothetical protein